MIDLCYNYTHKLTYDMHHILFIGKGWENI